MSHRDTLDLGAWCILRMGSQSTLPVFESLSRAGFDVWTPVERKIGRMPRTRTPYDKAFALMPSYVFAHVRHIEELAGIAMAPQKDHPRFTMFKYQNGFPLIAESELENLRAVEDRRQTIFEKLKRKGKKSPSFGKGSLVKIPEGPFGGLGGIVEGSQGQFTFVNIAGFPRAVQIASLLLLPDVAINEQPQGIAAQEAA